MSYKIKLFANFPVSLYGLNKCYSTSSEINKGSYKFLIRNYGRRKPTATAFLY